MPTRMPESPTEQPLETPVGPLSTDPAAIEDLYRFHKINGVRYARRRGAEDPEGLFDQVFVDVTAKIDAFEEQTHDAFASYLYRSLGNRVIAEGRRPFPQPVELDEQEDPLSALGPALDDRVADAQLVQELLTELTDAERDVIINRFFYDRTSTETARLLGKSPGAVRQLQHSAINRMRFLVAVSVLAIVALCAVVAVVRATLSEPLPLGPADSSEDGQSAPLLRQAFAELERSDGQLGLDSTGAPVDTSDDEPEGDAEEPASESRSEEADEPDLLPLTDSPVQTDLLSLSVWSTHSEVFGELPQSLSSQAGATEPGGSAAEDGGPAEAPEVQIIGPTPDAEPRSAVGSSAAADETRST